FTAFLCIRRASGSEKSRRLYRIRQEAEALHFFILECGGFRRFGFCCGFCFGVRRVLPLLVFLLVLVLRGAGFFAPGFVFVFFCVAPICGMKFLCGPPRLFLSVVCKKTKKKKNQGGRKPPHCKMKKMQSWQRMRTPASSELWIVALEFSADALSLNH